MPVFDRGSPCHTALLTLCHIRVSNQTYMPHSPWVLKGLHKKAGSKLFILRNTNNLFSSFSAIFKWKRRNVLDPLLSGKKRTKPIHVTEVENVV